MLFSRIIIICTVGLLLFPTVVSAAADDESLWLTAVEQFKKGHYQNAIVDLQGLIQAQPTRYESAARLLLAKCYLHLKDYASAAQVARRLISRFPDSRYASHAHYVLSEVAFTEGKYLDSARELLIAAQTTRDDDFNLQAREKMIGIFSDYLNKSEREEISARVESPDIAADLKYVMEGYRPPVKIGVILDLSGPGSEVDKSIAAGIRAAFSEMKGDLPHDVELLFEDTGGSIIQTVLSAEKLIRDERAVAVIGGRYSNSAAAVAGVTAAEKVPFLVTGAQDRVLTELGDGVFQLCADYYLEGETAAWFIWQDLEVRRVAVLAPATSSGSQRVDGFKNRFSSFNGTPVIEQWYYPEATSFKRQLDNLIRAGADSLALQLELTDDQIARLLDWDKEPTEEEQSSQDVADTMTTDVVDSLLEVYVSPINVFEALYIPIEGDEISSLAPQIAASGFDGYLIGDANCLQHVTKESDRRYVDGIIFPSYFTSPSLSSEERKGFAGFLHRTESSADVWSLLGWDAFGFLSTVLENHHKLSPRRVLKSLENERIYNGKYLQMSFPEGSRVNHSLYILSYRRGKFVQLKSPEEVAPSYQH